MGCQTKDAIREAFINSCFFDKEEKEKNRFAPTVWQPYKKVIILIMGSKFP
jgi:hypothetical protein